MDYRDAVDAASRKHRLEVVRQRLAHVDPDVLAAVAEVDLGLLAWARTLSPRQRLEACTRATRGLGRLMRAATD